MLLNRRQRLLLLHDLADLDRQIGEDLDAISAAQNAPFQRLARRQRCYWIQPCQYERLMQELRDEDVQSFKNFIQMETAMFKELITQHVLKNKTPTTVEPCL